MRIGIRGAALSIVMDQSFISFNSSPSICLYLLKIRIMMLNAMAASAAAIPIMNNVNVIPDGFSGATNLFKATKFRPAPCHSPHRIKTISLFK